MKGHWTKEPPAEPGTWKAARNTVEFIRVEYRFGKLGFEHFGKWYQIYQGYAIGITHWWSHPEELPPLPRDGRDG